MAKAPKPFLVTYHQPASAWKKMQKMTSEEKTEAMGAWMKWAASILRARSFAVLSWRDPAPALSMLRRAVWPVRFRTSPSRALSS